MTKTDTGEPAFPYVCDADFEYGTGMTLRDYFAAKAMLGLLSDSQVRGTPDEFAFRAYAMADAMLREKNND